jgi:alkylation response protein AidB-like acyl-CoA dehydrogenase
MDFELTDEQQAFREILRAFVEKEILPVAVEWEHSGRYPSEIIDKMKQMGLFGLSVPEEYGGMGADMVSFALVFEEIARGWMGVAGTIGSHSIACWMIARHGTAEQRRRHLPTWPAAPAVPRSRSPSPARARTCRASRPGRCGTATTTS